MGRFRAEIEQDFLAAYPDDLLRDVLRALAAVYPGALADCRSKHPAPETHDLYPHVRRAMLEYQLREIAKGYTGIVASAELNYKGTSYYTLLRSGSVYLTANAVETPSARVRHAMYRETYARTSQPNLFGGPLEEGTMLYGILLHGPEVKNKARPEFAHIAFPNQDCSEYIARI